MGISCDTVYTLKDWAEHLGSITYPLASDFWPHGAVARAYGVFNEEVGRPERAIIVVDAAGIVRYIDVHQFGGRPQPKPEYEPSVPQVQNPQKWGVQRP